MKRVHKITNENIEMVDEDTGEIKRIRLASDAQMSYLNSLRLADGKKPLEKKIAVYKASQQIDKLKKKQEKLL